jgi:glycosyltransferase involved in cell wall biosynthesis
MWTKNLELGIDAFIDLMQRRPDLSHFKMTIAGFVDLKSRPYLAKLREKAGSYPQVKFIEAPSDEELYALYGRASAIVYPPFNEDWGLVPLEAMMFGKPVVAVNRGGPRETVVDGENGFLTEPDPRSFSLAMERFADDPELVRKMGMYGRRHVNRFDWRYFIEAMDNCVDQLANPAGERKLHDAKSADSGFAY